MSTRLSATLTCIALILCSAFLNSASAGAELEASPWTKEVLYTEKISGKAGFGLTNLSVGWTALFFEPIREGWKGFATGPFYALTNTLGGILHTATFHMPFDIPLPGGGIAHDYAPE